MNSSNRFLSPESPLKKTPLSSLRKRTFPLNLNSSNKSDFLNLSTISPTPKHHKTISPSKPSPQKSSTLKSPKKQRSLPPNKSPELPKLTSKVTYSFFKPANSPKVRKEQVIEFLKRQGSPVYDYTKRRKKVPQPKTPPETLAAKLGKIKEILSDPIWFADVKDISLYGRGNKS